jgi:hypothetical protein
LVTFFSGVDLGVSSELLGFEVFLLSSVHSLGCGLAVSEGRFFLSSAKEKDPNKKMIINTMGSFRNRFRFDTASLPSIVDSFLNRRVTPEA